LPIAATNAVAVTGPTPGIVVSLWQAWFSFRDPGKQCIHFLDTLAELIEFYLELRQQYKNAFREPRSSSARMSGSTSSR
jgi:hypothetical protein